MCVYFVLKSMTGYGRGEFTNGRKNYVCEIRTVNHRYLDLNIRMPRQYNLIEDKLRKLVSKSLCRGKIEIYIVADEVGESSNRKVRLDYELVESYIKAVEELKNRTGLIGSLPIETLLQLPDIIKIEDDNIEVDVWDDLSEAVEMALINLEAMRTLEGEKLRQDMVNRLATIENLVNDIEGRASLSIVEYKGKLEKRVLELLDGVNLDQDRLALEVALMADKTDYTEEIVRFRSHIVQFNETTKQSDSVGRKLDFLVQEINREINTIGSKAQDVVVTNFVVNIKGELEKIREQVQNVE